MRGLEHQYPADVPGLTPSHSIASPTQMRSNSALAPRWMRRIVSVSAAAYAQIIRLRSAAIRLRFHVAWYAARHGCSRSATRVDLRRALDTVPSGRTIGRS